MLYEQQQQQPSRRRSFLVTGGIALCAVALFVFACCLGATVAVYATQPNAAANTREAPRMMEARGHAPEMRVGPHFEEHHKRLEELESMVRDIHADVQKLLEAPADVQAALQAHIAADADAQPSKWAASYLLPRYYQRDRGTCWDFATIGVLEQSYRENGVAKGYLTADQYVRFSEQAYGIATVRECAKHPEVCDVPGDFAIDNSTEGGEIDWIYSLTALYSQVLPLAVCPYTPDGDDMDCPAMDAALKTNPIKFDLKNIESAYSVEDSKAMMLKYQKPLGWSSYMHVVNYYFPCTEGYWSKQAACDEDHRVRCPTNGYYNSDYCAIAVGAMYNMDGEFYMHDNIVTEGGHAMNAVGFNDHFTTSAGFKGGFIIKNSWEDRVYGTSPAGRGARGSHSVQYWMQEISDWEERTICPNPFNPEHWLSCVQQSAGPTGGRRGIIPQIRGTTYDISETCLDSTFMTHLVNVTYQPTEFKCIDSNFCSTDSKYRYFLVESAWNANNDLWSACMLRYDTKTAEQLEICTPFNNPSAVAYIWNRA
eukprot:TRINITY_DN3123_c0_g1_i1.p1 TRINITY_DN3123_c0_g1~~TRINITY_DN3123_c0_g1_i1.p1  ORF type:complete len:538 (-),score=171.18 TRINITY_DN3123_c0_g1_i1:375-1988(-)